LLTVDNGCKLPDDYCKHSRALTFENLGLSKFDLSHLHVSSSSYDMHVSSFSYDSPTLTCHICMPPASPCLVSALVRAEREWTRAEDRELNEWRESVCVLKCVHEACFNFFFTHMLSFFHTHALFFFVFFNTSIHIHIHPHIHVFPHAPLNTRTHAYPA
jgi:hypothetical protein